MVKFAVDVTAQVSEKLALAAQTQSSSASVSSLAATLEQLLRR